MRFPRSPYKPLARPQHEPFWRHAAFPMIVIGAALAALALFSLYTL